MLQQTAMSLWRVAPFHLFCAFTYMVLSLCLCTHVESEVLPCNSTSVAMVSHCRYEFHGCSSWGDGLDAPLLSFTPSSGQFLENVTIVVTGGVMLPLIGCGRPIGDTTPVAFAATTIPSYGVSLEVRDVTMDPAVPLNLHGDLSVDWQSYSTWTFGSSCSPRLSITITNCVLYINSTTPLGRQYSILVPSAFLQVIVSGVEMSIVLSNVTAMLHTNDTQSMLTVNVQDTASPSNMTIKASNVSISMVGVPVSQPFALSSNRVVQAIFQVERQLSGGANRIANASIDVAGNCSFYVGFQLEESSSSPIDVLNVSYYAYIVHIESPKTSFVSNVTVVFQEAGRYLSHLHASHSAAVCSVDNVAFVSRSQFRFYNVIAHHTAICHTSAINYNPKVIGVFNLQSIFSDSVDLFVGNTSATFEGCSGAPEGLYESVRTPEVISSGAAITSVLVGGSISIVDVWIASSLTNGSACKSGNFQVATLTSSVLYVNGNYFLSSTNVVATRCHVTAEYEIRFHNPQMPLPFLALSVNTGIVVAPLNNTDGSLVVSASTVTVMRLLILPDAAIITSWGTSVTTANSTSIINLASGVSTETSIKNLLVHVSGCSMELIILSNVLPTDVRSMILLPPIAFNATIVISNTMLHHSYAVGSALPTYALDHSIILVSGIAGVGALVNTDRQVTLNTAHLSIMNVSVSSPVSTPTTAVTGYAINTVTPSGMIRFTGGGSRIVVNRSNFSGFGHLIAAMASQPFCNIIDEIIVQCVVWDNSGAVPKHSVPSPTSCLVVRRPFEVGCPYLESSLTASVSIMPEDNTTTPTPAPLVSTSTAAVVTAVTTVSTLLSLASAAGPFAQSLIIVGQSQCAPQAVQESTKDGRFLLSPFYALGDHGIVYGNIGLFGLLVGMQLIAVQFFKWRDRRAAG
ncbi:membrane-associated protein, putative, partial [Bodo saltans]